MYSGISYGMEQPQLHSSSLARKTSKDYTYPLVSHAVYCLLLGLRLFLAVFTCLPLR